MTVERIGVNGMSAELKQTYDRRLLSVAIQNLVAANYGSKKYIPANGGKSVEFRRFEKVAVGSHVLTEGTHPAETQATVSAVAATVSQYGAWLKVSDLLQVQGFDPVIGELTDKMGIHAAEVIDTIVWDNLLTSTVTQYAGGATVVGTSGAGAVGSGNYLNAAELLRMKRTLRRQNARPVVDGKFVVMLHPDNSKDLFEDPDIVKTFTEAHSPGADNPMVSGVLGDWNGLRFVETTNCRIDASNGMSGADVYNVVMVGAEAYGVTELSAMQMRTIIHPLGSGGHTDPLEQYSTVGWKHAMASVILNNNWMALLYCASSRSNAA